METIEIQKCCKDSGDCCPATTVKNLKKISARQMALGLLGWKVAALYLGTGLFIAVIAGWIIGRLRLEHWIEGWVQELRAGEAVVVEEKLTWTDRIERGREAVHDIVGKVWIYVVAGIAVGALIHGYVPEDLMASIMGKDAWWSVPAAVVVGIPMYSNAAGIVPVVDALLGKGAALGTVLAFMMSVLPCLCPRWSSCARYCSQN